MSLLEKSPIKKTISCKNEHVQQSEADFTAQQGRQHTHTHTHTYTHTHTCTVTYVCWVTIYLQTCHRPVVCWFNIYLDKHVTAPLFVDCAPDVCWLNIYLNMHVSLPCCLLIPQDILHNNSRKNMSQNRENMSCMNYVAGFPATYSPQQFQNKKNKERKNNCADNRRVATPICWYMIPIGLFYRALFQKRHDLIDLFADTCSL